MTPAVEKAYNICMDAHAGQFRRGKAIIIPYSTHPLAVAAMMDTEEEIIIALLHDVPEMAKDMKACFKELEKHFEYNIVTDIGAMTKLKGDHYIDDYIIDIARNHPRARKAKIADITHNLSCEPTERAKIKYMNAMRVLLAYIK
jgi:(p)ppGpp synthase/HD superfamily hydrolase